jgi:hypothetical protein
MRLLIAFLMTVMIVSPSLAAISSEDMMKDLNTPENVKLISTSLDNPSFYSDYGIKDSRNKRFDKRTTSE